MNSFSKRKYYFYLISIFILINISLEEENKFTFEIEIPFTEKELEILFINEDKKLTKNEGNDQINECKFWVPSLLNPVLLVPQSINITDDEYYLERFIINLPIFEKQISVNLYNYLFLKKYNAFSARDRYDEIKKCYLGLSNQLGSYPFKNETYFFLNILQKNNEIEKKIFSFNKWNIKKDSINSFFYLGFIHDDFNPKKKDGIIGTCEAKIDKFWGCLFNEISFNNNKIDLINNETGDYYKIYFTSETYNITFPKSFEDKFNNITENSCSYTTDAELKPSNLSCSFLDNNKNASLTLINYNMEITIEIDNIYRFSSKEDEIQTNETRIKYQEKIDYFIFPLIMFKNFHIQFDGENNLIKFYTTDTSILKLKNNKKEKDEKGISKGLIAFLIILIIIIVLVFGYGVFLFFKKRRGSLEKNINKYNKFEDEEHFQDMNEKRIF